MSILSREFRQTTVLFARISFSEDGGTHKSSEVATKGRKSSEVATTHEREHTDAAMVAIPPVLRPAWRRRLLLYVLLPYFLAGSAARAAEAPGPAPGAADDDALREDAYEWPRGPALEGLLPASAAGDEGLLATTSSSPTCDGENLSLLRVSPWPGCGAQATLALGWGDDDENRNGVDGRNTSDVAASVSSLVASLGAAGRGATATVTHAPQTSGMTAIALAMPHADPLGAAAVVDAALKLLKRLERPELVAVWALSSTNARPRPDLLVDFRELRLGGERHAAGKLKAARDAFLERYAAEGAGEVKVSPDPESSEVGAEDEAWSRSALEVLRESSRVLDHAEGPVARDLIVVAPRTFAIGSSAGGGSTRWKKSRGLFGGGRWAQSWLTVDSVARDSSVAATALTARIAGRRRRIYRAGLCGVDAASRSIAALEVAGQTTGLSPIGGGGGKSSTAAPWSCPDRRAGDAVALFIDTTEASNSSNWCPVRVPLPSGAPTSHLSRTTCDSNRSAMDAYPYPAGDAVTLRLDAAQRADFDDKRSFLRGTWEEMLEAKKKMTAAVELGSGDGVGIAAEIKFRGVSSFRDCVRKSLRVNLQGKTWRRLSPGLASDKFLLVSMCYDDRYVKTARVLKMAKAIGAFPHATPRYVRLLVENPSVSVNENNGLYLLMADPATGLVDARARTAAVVRRRNDAKRAESEQKGKPDVKYPRVDGPGADIADALTRAEYDHVAHVAMTCDPNACFEQLNEVLDVNQYLRWLALMTFVDSGDHVDEAWFFASDEIPALSLTKSIASPMTGPWRFAVHAWDPDDSFQSCHHGGTNALPDAHGTLKCAEADVDKALLRSPDVYARYMDWLEWTLRFGMTKRVAKGLANDALDDMFNVLSDDETAIGLTELTAANKSATTSAANARDDIRASGEWYSWLLEERRRVLLRRIGAWRETKGGGLMDEDDEGDDPFANFTKKFPRTVLAGGRFGRLTLTFDAGERTYDARRSQELVISDLKLVNRGRRPVRVFDPATGSSLFSISFGFNRTVVYRGQSYVARSEEFAVACWGDDVGVDPVRAAPRCDLGNNSLTVYPTIDDRTVTLRFRSEKPEETSELCGGCELALGTVSTHHEHWLGYADGIVTDGSFTFKFNSSSARSDEAEKIRDFPERSSLSPPSPPRRRRRRRRERP